MDLSLESQLPTRSLSGFSNSRPLLYFYKTKSLHVHPTYKALPLQLQLQLKGNSCKNGRPSRRSFRTHASEGSATLSPTQQETLETSSQHQPNVWEDAYLKSLRSPYLDPSHSRRLQSMIPEVKILLSEELKELSSESDDTVVERRLSLVESLISLGISRHFQNEIKTCLDFVFGVWKETEGVMNDLSSSASAFWMLRLHRYGDVSPDVFKKFKKPDGAGFRDCFDEKQSTEGVRNTLSLLKASRIQFPSEKILVEAEKFASDLLKTWFSKATSSSTSQAFPDSLIKEVKYTLDYPWFMSTPRWEARNFVEIYKINQDWLNRRKVNAKILELAKLEYNVLQAGHQEEIKRVSTWWNESEVLKLGIFRQRPVESYLLGAGGLFEPEFEAARIAIAKCFQCVFILDDIYDDYATLDELNILTDTFRRWQQGLNPAIPPLKDTIKSCFKFLLHTFSEFAHECTQKQQGEDMEPYIRERWASLVQRFQKEAEWLAAKEIPNVEDYLENGCESVALWPLFAIADLLSYPLPEPQIRDSFRNKIVNFYKLCGRGTRLHNDFHDFESINEEEDAVSATECYMKENPGISRRDAEIGLRSLMLDATKKVNIQYLDENEDSVLSKERLKVPFEVTRTMHFIYKNTDAFSISNGELRDQISLIYFQPID